MILYLGAFLLRLSQMPLEVTTNSALSVKITNSNDHLYFIKFTLCHTLVNLWGKGATYSPENMVCVCYE